MSAAYRVRSLKQQELFHKRIVLVQGEKLPSHFILFFLIMRGKGLSVINDVQCTKSPTNRTEPIYREAALIIIN